MNCNMHVVGAPKFRLQCNSIARDTRTRLVSHAYLRSRDNDKINNRHTQSTPWQLHVYFTHKMSVMWG